MANTVENINQKHAIELNLYNTKVAGHFKHFPPTFNIFFSNNFPPNRLCRAFIPVPCSMLPESLKIMKLSIQADDPCRIRQMEN